MAGADPAGPTDYASSIVDIDPPSDAVTAEMLGGDSFLQLTVRAGHEVIVTGYEGEPYLRFRADGVVEENRRSPSRWLNQDRYGEAGPGADADADTDAEPEWAAVGAGGRFSWHDHRTHWMNRARPLGAGPGDQILEAVVPLVIDGEPAGATVVSVWQAPPARWPAMAAALAAIAAAGVAMRRRGPAGPALLAAVGVAATVVGGVEFVSMPSEARTSPLVWALPVLGSIAAAAGVVLARRGAGSAAAAATTLAGLDLVLWGALRRQGLARAVLPTSLDWQLDRAVTAAALAAGALGALAGAAGVWRASGRAPGRMPPGAGAPTPGAPASTAAQPAPGGSLPQSSS